VRGARGARPPARAAALSADRLNRIE